MNDASLYVQARGIGENFARDPELSLPERPCFSPEIVVVPYQQKGLLFEGVRGRQVVLGASTRMFIPQLLNRLDGKHTIDQLCAQFPSVPRKAMNDALALLFSRGLLEDGNACPQPGRGAALTELAAFAGRFADVTRINRNRDAALDRLAQARVAIAGLPGHEVLLHALENQGIGSLRVIERPEDLAGSGELLLAVFSGDADAATWMRRAASLSMQVLHAHVGQDASEIGPLFVPDVSGCYDCFRRVQPAPTGAPGVDLAFWAGILALNALHLISRIGPVGLFNTARVSRHMPHGKLYDEVKLARLPGCPTCGLTGCGPQPDHPDIRTWLYHNACDTMPYHALRNPRDHQQHYAATNVQLAEQTPKPFYGAPATALPEGAVTRLGMAAPWLAPVAPVDRLGIADLASILCCAAGYQPGVGGLRRIAPNGGGLGAASMFVIARRVDGLAPGIYHYAGHTHSLERLGEVSDDLLEGALGASASPLPRAILVGTAHLVKLRRKYDNFAFRLGSLDAGVAKAMCMDAATALGVCQREYPDARDKVLAHLLGMPVFGNRNMITFALGLGNQATAALARGHHHYPDGLIEASSQLGATRVATPRLRPAGPPALVATPMPAFGQLLLARRSLRSYAAQALPGAVLEQILAAGAAIDEDCVAAGALPLRMTLWVVLTAGVPGAGVYRWDSAARLLEPRSAGVPMALLEASMSQRGFARAPVVVFVTGDFEQALTAHGPRGYRDMLNRAGSMMLRLLLAGTGLGVGGCMWGGVTEEACGSLLGIDRYRDCPLIGAALGYALSTKDDHE